ncbi:MAG: TIGR04255 family protein [Janthinobacterium lividum]
MEYGNHFVREAVCTFRFAASGETKDYLDHTWHFYQAIKDAGFTEKKRRPVHVNFKVRQDAPVEEFEPTVTHGSVASVFTNNETGYSIIFDENLISFNCVKNYTGWEIFLENFILPYLKIYIGLNIAQSLQNAQMAYINDVPLETSEKLSDYLSFIPSIGEHSSELSVVFQGNYQINPTLIASVQAMLSPVGSDNDVRRAIIECNSLASVSETISNDWLDKAMELAAIAHDNACSVFANVATTHFKTRIK